MPRVSIFPILAFIVSLASTAVIVVVAFYPINLTHYGTYNGKARAAYTAVSTIIATSITMFIMSQIRNLMIRDIDVQLTKGEATRLQQLGERWRTILGVASLMEIVRNSKVQLSFIGVGLITAALVSAFTPTTTTRVIHDYSITISSGQPYPSHEFCANVFPPGTEVTGWGYFWNMTDGRIFWVNIAGDSCASRRATNLIASINKYTPNSYAYTVGTTSVHASAMGVPVSVISWPVGYGQHLAELVDRFPASVAKTSQCVPVMVHNPIRCRRGGNVVVNDRTIEVVSDDGHCRITNTVIVDPSVQPTLSKGLCTVGEVGEVTIVLGGTRGYGALLGVTVGDENALRDVLVGESSRNPKSTYAVTCTVDTRDVYSFRKVQLSLRGATSETNGWFATAESEEPCDPGSQYPIDMSGLRAVAATSSWQVLIENSGLDGWFDAIYRSSGTEDKNKEAHIRSTFAFSDSRNGLEDALGVTAAMVGSYMNSSWEQITAEATISNTRMGSGQKWAVIFALPPLFSTAFLLLLIWSARHGGDVSQSSTQIENTMMQQQQQQTTNEKYDTRAA
ncbi:hypothetical protein BKA66DRAFT_436476 [Pyrenochaeta sp. MPI-SDFR-AT-0127]|nr:hypothetical protein BKA66DRAFT_436476 [Pyrenochaeta sp. MPI-SDFR-AT-0127]